MVINIKRRSILSTRSTLEELEPEITRPKTLEDVIIQLSADNTLTSTRRRDLVSACNSIARLTRQTTGDIPAKVVELRSLLKNVHPVQGQISKKRLTNIRSDLAVALEHAGVIPTDIPKAELLPAWQAFLNKATVRQHVWVLSRFSRYCSHHGVEPADVTEGTIRQFQEWLDARVLTNDPVKIVKDTVNAFNAIIKRSNLNLQLVTAATSERYVARRLDSYPLSFRADSESYLQRLRKPDLFSGFGPSRALRPISIRNIEAHIRQLLDAAVEAGYPTEHFQSLADLINIDVIEAATSHMIERRGGSIPSGLGNILATVMAIARHHLKLEDAILTRIATAQRRVGQKLGTDRPSMSSKNQRRMDQFEDRENITRLVNLPIALMKHAERASERRSSTLDAMAAAAIAILLSCPMRIKNLSHLHIQDDMTIVKQGKNNDILIHISADKTKARQDIDAIISSPYSTIITRYITYYRKHAADSPEGWLFPAISGGPRSPDHFGAFIKDRIFRETGIVMNAHLFRHFSAFVYLEANPGNYEDVRRIVGHAKMDTTTSFYAPVSTKAAYKRYGTVLQAYISREVRK